MRIGILGCGQAGSRIALTLKSFDPTIELVICDPSTQSPILDNTGGYSVAPVAVHTDDEEFFADRFDKLVIAADPLSLMATAGIDRPKMLLLAEYGNKDIPVLAERPLGYASEHPAYFKEYTGLRNISVLNYTDHSALAMFLSSYQPLNISIDATINCGLAEKPWRQNPDVLPLAVHFGDQYFSLLDAAIGDFKISSASVKRSQLLEFEYDRNWSIAASCGDTTVFISMSQYAGASEYQFSQDRIRATGPDFTAEIGFGGYKVTLADGSTDEYDHTLAAAPDAIRPAAAKLHRYLLDVEAYPDVKGVEGLARSIAANVIGWHSNLSFFATGLQSSVERAAKSIAVAHEASSLAARL